MFSVRKRIYFYQTASGRFLFYTAREAFLCHW